MPEQFERQLHVGSHARNGGVAQWQHVASGFSTGGVATMAHCKPDKVAKDPQDFFVATCHESQRALPNQQSGIHFRSFSGHVNNGLTAYVRRFCTPSGPKQNLEDSLKGTDTRH